MSAMAGHSTSDPRRALPSVERLLQVPAAGALVARYRRAWVVETIRAVLDDVRRNGARPPADDELIARVAARLEASAAPRLGPVVNATGVVLHTNLGRALLAKEACDAVLAAARGAVNLELDLT